MVLKILLGFVCVMLASAAVAEDKKSMRSLNLNLNYLPKMTYEDVNYDEAKEKGSEQSDVDMSGTQFDAAVLFKGFALELDYRSFKPQSLNYWSATTQMEVLFSYYWKNPWVSPVFGYFQMNQQGDRNDADAPSVFIEKSNALVFGLHLDMIPFTVFSHYGVVLLGRYHHLTTGQASVNFGNEYQAGGGLIYREKSMVYGLVYQVFSQTMYSVLPDENNPDALRRVRSKMRGASIGFYIEY